MRLGIVTALLWFALIATPSYALNFEDPVPNTLRIQQWLSKKKPKLPIPTHREYTISHNIELCGPDASSIGALYFGGCYWEVPGLIVVRPYKSMYNYAYIFFHEVGHAFDYAYLSEVNRRSLLPLLRRKDWYTSDYEKRGMERFAIEYAKCVQWRIAQLRKKYPLAQPKKRICRTIMRYYRRGPLIQLVNGHSKETTAS